MTAIAPSGAHLIDITLIDVPEKRWRAVSKKVEDIAQSLLVHGQLQPIILRAREDGRYELVDGLHRLTAHQMNAALTIEALFTQEVDSIKLREIELEVNIQRMEMTWQERQLATAELHKLKMEIDPNWNQASTAALLETQQPKVAEALKLAEMMKLFPEIGKAKNRKQALSWMSQKAASAVRTMDVAANPEAFAGVEEHIFLGDSVEFIKGVPDESIHLVLTDPPFGIDYDSRKAGIDASMSSYEDTPEQYERILSMANDLYRVIKPNGWLTWFCGISWYERCKTVFRAAGFTVDEIPVIWDRSQGSSFTARPDRYYARAYDIALHCIKGEPQMVVRGKPNILQFAPVTTKERELLVERPVELYAEIIRRLTVKGETVADFFLGSGSSLAAASSLQRRFMGVEQDPGRRATAINKIKAHTPS